MERFPKLGQTNRMVETLFIILLPVFAILFIWQAFEVPEPPRNIVVGPRTFPVLLGVLMLAVSGCLVWRRLKAIRSEASASFTGEEDEDILISDWPAVWFVLATLLAEVLLLETLGFVVTLSLFLFLLSTVFAPQSWVRNLVVSLTFSFAVYFAFTAILRIPLPNGVLGFAF